MAEGKAGYLMRQLEPCVRKYNLNLVDKNDRELDIMKTAAQI